MTTNDKGKMNNIYTPNQMDIKLEEDNQCSSITSKYIVKIESRKDLSKRNKSKMKLLNLNQQFNPSRGLKKKDNESACASRRSIRKEQNTSQINSNNKLVFYKLKGTACQIHSPSGKSPNAASQMTQTDREIRVRIK